MSDQHQINALKDKCAELTEKLFELHRLRRERDALREQVGVLEEALKKFGIDSPVLAPHQKQKTRKHYCGGEVYE